MAFFNRNKGKVIDYSANYKVRDKKQVSSAPISTNQSDSEGYSALGFLGNLASSASNNNNNNNPSTYSNYSSRINDSQNAPQETNEERKSKLAKRLLDMTNRLEDLSNQIYHLSQRLELVEKRLKINFE